MKKNNILLKLTKIGFIFNEPIMRGIYIWRVNGIKCSALLLELLNSKFSKSIQKINIPCFTQMSRYKDIYINIANYNNVFYFKDYDYLIRTENTSFLLKELEKNPNKIFVSNDSLYRQFQSKAFLIDQRIWPASGYVMTVQKESINKDIDIFISSVNSFFSDMLLPIFWIEESDGFKKFAKRMYFPLMPENNEHLTLVSTLFILSSAFTSKMNINSDVLQFGFSERLFYTYFIMQKSNNIILPSSVAPYQVIFKQRELEIINKEIIKNFRYKISDRVLTFGAPIELFMKNRLLFLRILYNKEIQKVKSESDIFNALKKSDQLIKKDNQNFFDNVLQNYEIQYLCTECKNNLIDYAILGMLYKSDVKLCGICMNKKAKKFFLLNNQNNKSINEKLIKKHDK